MDYSIARQNMVDGQLRPNRINQTLILNQMAVLPREMFAPEAAAPYADAPLPIAADRMMFSPLLTAHLLQSLDMHGEGTLLVVGCGTGYGAALAAAMATQVTCVETNATLAASAKHNFRQLGLPHVTVVDDIKTLHGQVFDAVLVDTPVHATPADVLKYVREGGRVAYVHQTEQGLAQAVLGIRHGNVLFNQPLFETKTMQLKLSAPPSDFVF